MAVRVQKYYRNGRQSTDEAGSTDTQIALGTPGEDELAHGDEETLAAAAYINSVREEAWRQPIAVEAVIASPPQLHHTVSSAPEYQPTFDIVHETMKNAIIEYFVSLRMLLKKDGIEHREILIDFGEDYEDVLSSADSVSVTRAVEDLSELDEDLSSDLFADWLFGLLVYLDEPLLEDTAASLQSLLRSCRERIGSEPEPLRNKFHVCSLIIRFYFNQR
jgi:hypothetical protein